MVIMPKPRSPHNNKSLCVSLKGNKMIFRKFLATPLIVFVFLLIACMNSVRADNEKLRRVYQERPGLTVRRFIPLF
jgi:hypothetical protein